MTTMHRPPRLSTALLATALLAPLPSWAAEPGALGRLFLTPVQRQQLDRQRLNPTSQSAATEPETSQTFNGEVRRSDGRTTRWVNGEAMTGPLPKAQVPIGDTYHPESRTREGLLGSGTITVRPAPAR